MTSAPQPHPRHISRLNIVLVLLAIAGAVAACFFRLDLDPAALEAKYAADPASRFVEASGIRFHLTDRGQGPVLVLIHGQAANFTVWEAAARLLAADHRVIDIDMPGHGLTGPDPQQRYTPPEIAADLDALMGALGIDRFALAGNSLGGGVSQEYALAHPQKLTALLLVDPVGAPMLGPMPTAFATQTLPLIGPLMHWFTPDWIVKPVLATTFGNPARLSADDAEATYELLLRAGNRQAQYLTLLGAIDTTLADRMAGITTPTLLLWGTRDTWLTPDHEPWFATHIPGIEVKMLEGLGHQPMMEDPQVTVAAMEAFLNAHGA